MYFQTLATNRGWHLAVRQAVTVILDKIYKYYKEIRI
jgi:hypothetical protein